MIMVERGGQVDIEDVADGTKTDLILICANRSVF